MNTNDLDHKSGHKLIEQLLPSILCAVIAGIILLPITDFYKKLTENPPVPESSSSDSSDSSDSSEIFKDYVSNCSNGKIKYSSPEYGIDVILPDGCLCIDYHPALQKSPEEIELQYDSDLKIDVIIGEMPYEGFNSLEEYSDYYFEIYKQFPNFYKYFNFKKSIPYCVFSFNTDNGQRIYYELIYNSNGMYCATKFNYPTSKRSVYDEIVSDYVRDTVLGK